MNERSGSRRVELCPSILKETFFALCELCRILGRSAMLVLCEVYNVSSRLLEVPSIHQTVRARHGKLEPVRQNRAQIDYKLCKFVYHWKIKFFNTTLFFFFYFLKFLPSGVNSCFSYRDLGFHVKFFATSKGLGLISLTIQDTWKTT